MRKPLAAKPRRRLMGRRRPTLILYGAGADSLEPLGGPFLPTQPVFLGRSARCDVSLPLPGVSQKHALFVCGPDGIWRVFDLQSTQGVYVNGERVPKARLEPDSRLHIAGCDLRVVLGHLQPGHKFEEFELAEPLHEGCRGKVYRASWPKKANPEVAIHIFPDDFQLHACGSWREKRCTTPCVASTTRRRQRVTRARAAWPRGSCWPGL